MHPSESCGKKLSYDSYRLSPAEYVRWGLQGLLLGTVVLFLFYNRIISAVLLPFFVFFYLKNRQKQQIKNRQELLLQHFSDFLSALQSAMRTGYSLENAVAEATRELRRRYGKEDLLVRELVHIQGQLQMSVPVEQLFRDLGERSHLEDLEDFAEVLSIGKRMGGDFDKILDHTFWILNDKIETGKEIQTAIAAKNYEFLIMSLVPLGVILYIRISFRGFLDCLYGNGFGVCFMSVCLVFYGLAWKLGKKITEIEV